MNSFFDEIGFPTNKEFELIDITEKVRKAVSKSGMKNGIMLVFSQHTTGVVRISENEEGLMQDYKSLFERTVPKEGKYIHNKTNIDNRPNAHSHLQSMFLNSSETIPLKDGEMMLGKWQSIFFVEVDGPRPERKVVIEVVGL